MLLSNQPEVSLTDFRSIRWHLQKRSELCGNLTLLQFTNCRMNFKRISQISTFQFKMPLLLDSFENVTDSVALPVATPRSLITYRYYRFNEKRRLLHATPSFLSFYRKSGQSNPQSLSRMFSLNVFAQCPSQHLQRGVQGKPFLPCDAMRCTVFVIVILSVSPSVRLSVTLVDCVHMVRPTTMIYSPYGGNPIILVSGDITFIPKFEGGHPERGR